MPSNHLILCHPLLLLPSTFPSIRVFSNESTLGIRWPKYWSFSFNIHPTNEHPGLISFRMDWLDLLAVQGTLKCLFQHHSSKALILRHSAFFIVQLSRPYMTTGKTRLWSSAINYECYSSGSVYNRLWVAYLESSPHKHGYDVSLYLPRLSCLLRSLSNPLCPTHPSRILKLGKTQLFQTDTDYSIFTPSMATKLQNKLQTLNTCPSFPGSVSGWLGPPGTCKHFPLLFTSHLS